MNHSECRDFELGTSLANKRRLTFQNLPQPDTWTYQPYSVVKLCGDGTKKGYGYPTASWTWGNLSQAQVNSILDWFAAASDASATVYIKTAMDTGRGRQTIDDFVAIVDRITDGNGKTMVDRTSLPVFSGITVTFTHLVP